MPSSPGPSVLLDRLSQAVGLFVTASGAVFLARGQVATGTFFLIIGPVTFLIATRYGFRRTCAIEGRSHSASPSKRPVVYATLFWLVATLFGFVAGILIASGALPGGPTLAVPSLVGAVLGLYILGKGIRLLLGR